MGKHAYKGSGFGAFTDWELRRARGGKLWVPVYAMLSGVPDGDVLAVFEKTRGVALPGFEADLLATELARVDGDALDCRVLHYVRVRKQKKKQKKKAKAQRRLIRALDKVGVGYVAIHAGPPARIKPGKAARPRVIGVPSEAAPEMPFIAVVDDAIGYLNAGFSDRIEAFWAQTHGTKGNRDRWKRGVSGLELTQAQIAARRDHADPAAVYAGDAETLYARTEPRPLMRRASHGTHVLSLAAGDASLGDVPLLAVQLPPYGTMDTSGRLLEIYAAVGLRWLRHRARMLTASAARRPLIVNLSLGAMAGPGDDSAFLAQAIAHEMDRYRAETGEPMRVVAAYGNMRRDALVARAGDLAEVAPFAIGWAVPPDDRTSSYLELRRSDAGATRVSVAGPAGSGIAAEIDWPAPGRGRWLTDASGRRVGLIAGLDEARPAALVALAPTVGTPRQKGPLAPSGVWKIRVDADASEAGTVTARVLRDDSVAGYPLYGRQSRLVSGTGGVWDEQMQDFGAPTAPVTTAGTASSLAGVAREGFRTVAAGLAGGWRGAARPYSGEGVTDGALPGQSAGPTIMAPGDAGPILGGVRASGTQGGTFARFSGTSAAAPQVTRALALAYLARGETPPEGLTEMEELAIFDGEPATNPDPRTGRGALRE